jgi:hypothetical protein
MSEAKPSAVISTPEHVSALQRLEAIWTEALAEFKKALGIADKLADAAAPIAEGAAAVSGNPEVSGIIAGAAAGLDAANASVNASDRRGARVDSAGAADGGGGKWG